MNDDELHELLEALEAALRAEVARALAQVADDFAEGLDGATELVAAVFRVSSIAALWRRRVSGIMTALRRITGRAVRAVADDLGVSAPEVDLSAYEDSTEVLLNAVGPTLASEAVRVLADGLNAGEDVETLRDRLRTAFAADGTHLGPGRAQRIAVTEATRAWNAASLAAAQAIEGADRPLVKQWVTRMDDRVRPQHRDASGQLRLLDEPFDVAGVAMQYPGDPTAPADLTIGCRCVLRTAAARERTASMSEAELSADADGSHRTGAMVALVPDEASAKRLALEGGEEAAQLHTTLFFLGDDGDVWDEVSRAELTERVTEAARSLGPVRARAFGAAQWNPGGENPCWVYSIGDHADGETHLLDVHQAAQRALEGRLYGPQTPVQYSPWAPHVCAVYSAENVSEALAARCGDVTFDRIRLAFAGAETDIPLTGPHLDEVAPGDGPPIATWTTPGESALGFENEQTGDGRVITPGALYWTGGPWPLKFDDESGGEDHDGARLAGAIQSLTRDGSRLAASGVLYLNQDAGVEAAMLLSQGAPLGVSLDLDDVDFELVRMDPDGPVDEPWDCDERDVYRARMLRASVRPLDGGGWVLIGESAAEWYASDLCLAGKSVRDAFHVGPEGLVPADAFELDAAAGDGADGGTVVHEEKSGQMLMRITRARVRGATLVSIPAYDRARITLDDPSRFAAAASLTSGAAANDYDRVVRHARKSLVPVTAADVARFLKLPITAVRRHLARAAQRGDLVRITRGTYTAPIDVSAAADEDGLEAAATGSADLPVAGRSHPWDGDAAEARVFAWADGDCDKLDLAFAWRDESADCIEHQSRKLGFADVIDNTLTIIPRGVFAAQAAVEGARGGVDIPADQLDAVRNRLAAIRRHVDEATDSDMEASAWTAMRDIDPMPAAWFREPTPEELPPGGPGVNYSGGRIFGWVAQAGEPHAGYARKVTIDGLGRIDTTHFLRQRFELDDGSTVKAGAFTMNVGHHRDGAECETSACQFDDTRFVAGIVTVGMNERGMWFSGAAAPWLAEWDRKVFMAAQPSYHLKRGGDGAWQLRAVLSVPVPGHSSPLLATAVAGRAQMALTAAAAMVDGPEVVPTPEDAEAGAQITLNLDYDALAEALVAALDRAEQRDRAEEIELQALMAEGRELIASWDPDDHATVDDGITGTEGE